MSTVSTFRGIAIPGISVSLGLFPVTTQLFGVRRRSSQPQAFNYNLVGVDQESLV